MDCLIGIDIVSTRIKSVIHDEKGKMVSEGAARTIFSHLDKGYRTWSVWELENIWKSVCAATKQAIFNVSKAQRIRAVAVTGFGMDGLPMTI